MNHQQFSRPISFRLLNSHTLPPLPFFAVAFHTPQIILDGLTYDLIKNDPPPIKNGPYFRIEQLYFELSPAQSLATIEQQYITVIAAVDLNKAKTHYMQHLFNQSFRQVEEFQKQLVESEVLAFLLEQLIPKFEVLEGVKAEHREKQLDALTHHQRWLQFAPIRQSFSVTSILETLIGRHALILDEKVYSLCPIKPIPDQDLLVFANDQHYTLAIPGQFLCDLNNTFFEMLDHELHRQTMAELPDQQQLQAQLEIEAENFKERIQHPIGYLYKGRLYGIMQQKDDWVVYCEVPPYIVEAADGQLYRFEATQVGVHLPSCQPERIFTDGNVCVLSPYPHMFVSSGRNTNSICLAKEKAYYTRLQNMPLADALCLYLYDAKYTLMAGHHSGNHNTPYHKIENCAHQRLTTQEARQQGLPIFPYYR